MYQTNADRDLVASGLADAQNGFSLFRIAAALGVTKEWLRTYAQMSDR